MDNSIKNIGGNISNELSVFYLITYQCRYSLGYLPEAKSLPAGNLNLADELHRERLLAGEWLIQDAEVIKNRIAPEIIAICSEFTGYLETLQDGREPVDTEVLQSLNRLKAAADKIGGESEHLKNWLKSIRTFHKEVMEQEQSAPQPGFYSWQDAAGKLDAVLQAGDKLSVMWSGVLVLVDEAVKELEQAKESASQIVREMFCEAAVKQWQDAAELAKSLRDIKNPIEYSQ